MYSMKPPSKATGVVGQEDSSTASGNSEFNLSFSRAYFPESCVISGKEGVNRNDANPKMQKSDVRQGAV